VYTFGPIPDIDYHQYLWITRTNPKQWPYVVRYDSDRIDALNPRLQPRVRSFLNYARDLGLAIKVVSTTRTLETQAKLYEQGRTRPGWIVTYVKPLTSYHNYGLAWDIALIGKLGKPDYSLRPDHNANGLNDWEELGYWALTKFNILWGGYFPEIRDLPHFEYHPNQNELETLWRLTHGYNPLKE
jgi:peptidoglycan L-alanyl-D-glutamate endopeptidase CwlK